MDMMPMIWCVDQFHIMTFTHRCHSHQWDLGEFDQKGAIATRWGTKDQLTRACSIARQHGVGPVITAVLNVRHLELVFDLMAAYSTMSSKSLVQTHQNDSWQSESTQGTDCARSKKKRKSVYVPSNMELFAYHVAFIGMDRIRFPRATRKGSVILILRWFISPVLEQYSKMKWTHEHFTGQPSYPIADTIIHLFTGVDWDDITKISGVYRITSEGHKGWSQHVSKELGNYDYLFGVDVCILSNSLALSKGCTRSTITIRWCERTYFLGVPGSRMQVIVSVCLRLPNDLSPSKCKPPGLE